MCEGTIRTNFLAGPEPQEIAQVVVEASLPPDTWVKSRVRTRSAEGGWSTWQDASDVSQLPSGVEAEVETTLHTDDGYVTPTVKKIELVWK